VVVTYVRFREVSYIAADKSFSGRVPQWMFLQDFRPIPDTKKKPRRPAANYE